MVICLLIKGNRKDGCLMVKKMTSIKTIMVAVRLRFCGKIVVNGHLEGSTCSGRENAREMDRSAPHLLVIAIVAEEQTLLGLNRK